MSGSVFQFRKQREGHKQRKGQVCLYLERLNSAKLGLARPSHLETLTKGRRIVRDTANGGKGQDLNPFITVRYLRNSRQAIRRVQATVTDGYRKRGGHRGFIFKTWPYGFYGFRYAGLSAPTED